MPQLEEVAVAPELKLPAEKTAGLEAAYRVQAVLVIGEGAQCGNSDPGALRAFFADKPVVRRVMGGGLVLLH